MYNEMCHIKKIAIMFYILMYRERGRAEVQITARNLHSAPTPLIKQQHEDAKRLYQEQMIQRKVHINNLKVGTWKLSMFV